MAPAARDPGVASGARAPPRSPPTAARPWLPRHRLARRDPTPARRGSGLVAPSTSQTSPGPGPSARGAARGPDDDAERGPALRLRLARPRDAGGRGTAVAPRRPWRVRLGRGRHRLHRRPPPPRPAGLRPRRALRAPAPVLHARPRLARVRR